ncbi:MAG: ABC transporter substrate-binding protein [Candidatus Aerophobetes bacterium]
MFRRTRIVRRVLVVGLSLALLAGLSVGVARAEEVRFGVLTSLSGPLGTEGKPCFETIQWTVEEINKFGGPLGMPIKLFVADTATDVERGITGARKLITMDRVINLIGPSSSIVVAIMKFAADNEVPIISHWSGSTRLTTSGGEYQFRTCPDDYFEGEVAARFMWDEGFRKAAVITLDTEDTISISDALKKRFTAMGGEIVVDELVVGGQTTYRTAARKVLAKRPDVLFPAIDLDTLKIVYRELYEMGISFTVVLASNALQQATMDIVGADALEGVYGEKPANALGSPAYAIFEQKYIEHMEDGMVGWFTPNMYDAVNLMALAVEAAGEATGKGISENIRKVANPPGIKVYSYAEGLAHLLRGHEINYEGASGSVDFDEFGNVLGYARIQQAKGGQWVDIKFYSSEDLAEAIR